MGQEVQQEIHGDNNIQVGRDIKIFRIYRASVAEAIRAIDGYLVLFYLVLVGCLVGTTLPHPVLNILTSAGTAGTLGLIAVLHLERRRISESAGRSFRSFQVMVVLLVAASVLSGCSGYLFADKKDKAVLDALAEHINTSSEGAKVKTGTVQGIGVLGFGLEDVNLQSAMAAGDIKLPFAADSYRSYGLISMARVTVYGE